MLPEPYPYVFYNTRWRGYFMLVFGMGFLVIALTGLAGQRASELAGLLFFSFAALFIWLGWRVITEKKPVLQFGRNGIWTSKLGDIQWQEVLLDFSHVSTGKAGSFDFLRITDKRTSKVLDSVVITSLDKSVEDIRASLNTCKKAQFKHKNGH